MKYPLRVGTDRGEENLIQVPDSERDGIRMQSVRIHNRVRTPQRWIRWMTHLLDS
jgi:hypothetical protein